MQNNIGISSYSATFWVKTIHDSKLEVVLEQADERNGNFSGLVHVTTTYTDKLLDMLKQEFVRDNVDVPLVSEYVNFHIDTIENLQSVPLCVVTPWLASGSISTGSTT